MTLCDDFKSFFSRKNTFIKIPIFALSSLMANVHKLEDSCVCVYVCVRVYVSVCE